MVKTLPANAQDLRDSGSIPRSRRSLQEGMANHFSILAWKIPWLEEPGRLQSMGSHRVGHDWSLSTYTHTTTLGDTIMEPEAHIYGIIMVTTVINTNC